MRYPHRARKYLFIRLKTIFSAEAMLGIKIDRSLGRHVPGIDTTESPKQVRRQRHAHSRTAATRSPKSLSCICITHVVVQNRTADNGAQ